MNPPQPLLRVSHMQTHFHTFEGVAKAVDDVSFNCMPGETLGLVGESGSGKSVTALSNRIAMIFQEPMTSLNPVFTIGNQISEMFILHRKASRKDALDASIEMLDRVQIPAPERRIDEYPHQLSGGMRQRAMIAMALACDPEILIADEPTTALDVTVQAQILDLMIKLKEDFGTAVQMITHDLGVIAEMADRIVVMYAGRVVEEARTVDLFENPVHPYTQGLLNSVPVLGRRSKKGRTRLKEISGVVPSLYELPKGCSFHPRCTQSMEVCIDRPPRTHELEKGHRVSCWLCESGHNSQDQAKDQGSQS
jgi:oligopeptide/dipeptide ABC transporter ATP-binding protein